MALSSDLISQFAKITKDNTDTKKESTVYGTTVVHGGTTYVKLDGSDRLTPVSTTTDTKDGERVTVMIKNHTATITGNISSPAARTEDTKKTASNVTELEIATAYRITTEDLNAVTAYIDNLKTIVGKFENVSTEDLTAVNAEIESIESKFINVDTLTAEDVRIVNATIESIQGKLATFTDVSTDDLEAANAVIGQLKAYNAKFTYVFADELDAINANIKNLNVDKLSAKDADLKYANIDFTNIGKAAMEYFYANSGLIEGVIVGDGTITGHLVGVTISGDLIEANTLVAEKLVIKGEDGLYYKLNMGTGEQVYSGTTLDGEDVYYAITKVISYYRVGYDPDADVYVNTNEPISILSGSELEGIFTETGEQVYLGNSDAEDDIYYTSLETEKYYKVSHDSTNNKYSITNDEIEPLEGTIVKDSYIEAEQTEYNSLDGKNILAKSITATQITVDDLVAFDATIGGFEIADDSIHSFGKDSVDNTTKGIYLDRDGQVNFGDANNFIKYYITETIPIWHAVSLSYADDDVDYMNPIFTVTDVVLDLDEETINNLQYSKVETPTTTGEQVYHLGGSEAEFCCAVNDYKYGLEISAEKITFGVDGKSVEDEIQDTKDSLEKHFEFSDNGLVIKLGDNTMKLRLDNDIIAFYKGEIDENDLTKNRFGWWDGVDFHTGNIVVNVNERAQFGDFAFVPRSDGSLSFLKVAGEVDS